jgi:hypothetical protein
MELKTSLSPNGPRKRIVGVLGIAGDFKIDRDNRWKERPYPGRAGDSPFSAATWASREEIAACTSTHRISAL